MALMNNAAKVQNANVGGAWAAEQAYAQAFGLTGQAGVDAYEKIHPEQKTFIDQAQAGARAVGIDDVNAFISLVNQGVYSINGVSTAYGNLFASMKLDTYEVGVLNQAISDAKNGIDQFNSTKPTGPLRQSASGNPLKAGEISQVNEHGPEVWESASGNQYMMAPGNGRVIPTVNSHRAQSARTQTSVVSVGSIIVQGTTDVRETALAVRDVLLNLSRSQSQRLGFTGL